MRPLHFGLISSEQLKLQTLVIQTIKHRTPVLDWPELVITTRRGHDHRIGVFVRTQYPRLVFQGL